MDLKKIISLSNMKNKGCLGRAIGLDETGQFTNLNISIWQGFVVSDGGDVLSLCRS